MSTYKIVDSDMSQKILIKRRQQNLTLTDMANQVSVTRATISQIERGRKQVVQERIFNSLSLWLSKEG